jgi:hypothetical protein
MQIENIHHEAWFILNPQPLCKVSNNHTPNHNGKHRKKQHGLEYRSNSTWEIY